jgi:hypothetical protein
VLLDENLPRLLRRELPNFHVRTVAEAGWAGVTNGRLLRLAEAEFDVFVTADLGLPHQQTLSTLTLGVVVLAAGSTKLEDLRPLCSGVAEAVAKVQPGQVLHVPPV